jgi:hypothetical protein
VSHDDDQLEPPVGQWGSEISQHVVFPQVGLSGQLAGAIADLVSLERDVSFARDCALTYAKNAHPIDTPKDDNTRFLCQAVWAAGAISYRRAFTSGKGHLVKQGSRLKINDRWKDILEPELLAAHGRVMETANQHIAHRVGDEEGVRIVAVLNPPPGPRAVAAIGHMLIHAVGPEPVVAERLTQVCTVLLELIATEKARLEAILLEKLREQDVNQLYAAAETPGAHGGSASTET